MRNREWIYATPAQESYIKRLRNEAFSLRAETEYGPISNSRSHLKSEASAEIDMLKRCIAKAKAKTT